MVKSGGNIGSVLEDLFKKFIEGECFCYVFLNIVGFIYKLLCCVEYWIWYICVGL